MNDYNLMIDEQFFFDELVKTNLKIYDNIWKIAIGKGNDYMTSYPLDYNHFNQQYNALAIDSRKQQAPHADLKAIQEIYFTGNLNRGEMVNDNTKMFFIIENQIFHQ